MRSCQIVKLWGVAYIWTRLIKLETNISDYCCASQSGVHPARVDRLSYRSLVLLRGQICHSLRSYHNMSPPDPWKWKWSNGVGKTANFTDFRLSYRSLVLLRGQICNSINQLDVSLFGETDKSGNLTRLAFFTFLLYKHLIQHNNLLQNPFHEIDM